MSDQGTTPTPITGRFLEMGVFAPALARGSHSMGLADWAGSGGCRGAIKLVIMPYKPKHVTYFWQHPSAQPTWAGAWRHIGGASARFRQDINMRIDAYESWERPLYVAKFLDMDRIFSYLWIRIFISVKIRKNAS